MLWDLVVNTIQLFKFYAIPFQSFLALLVSVEKHRVIPPDTLTVIEAQFWAKGSSDERRQDGRRLPSKNPSTVLPCTQRCTQLTSESATSQAQHFSFFLCSIPYKHLVTTSFIHNYLFEIADINFWPYIGNVLFFWSFSMLPHSAPRYRAILLMNF